VCRGYTCDKPVTEAEELSAQLDSAGRIINIALPNSGA
jgi:hypothetical protein